MKKLLNTLYLLTPDSYLFCRNETIAVKIGGQEKNAVPAKDIEAIVCFGQMTVSTPLLEFCGERGIGLTFLSENGRFYGRINGPVSGNVLLRQRQFLSCSDPLFSARMAAHFLCGKLLNEKNMLMRAARETADGEREKRLKDKALEIAGLSKDLKEPLSTAAMRGIEGAAAAAYFSCFDMMLKTKEMRFEERSRRPPKNEVNAVLSFLYMLLKNDVQSALEAVGLDPACGYLHTLRPGRPALALDIMEELRAPLCDRMALALFNRGQLDKKDFDLELGQCLIEEKARKLLISSWQNRKKETVQHPFIKEKIDIGLIPFVEAQLLARVLRGDLDEYPPFIWR